MLLLFTLELSVQFKLHEKDALEGGQRLLLHIIRVWYLIQACFRPVEPLYTFANVEWLGPLFIIASDKLHDQSITFFKLLDVRQNLERNLEALIKLFGLLCHLLVRKVFLFSHGQNYVRLNIVDEINWLNTSQFLLQSKLLEHVEQRKVQISIIVLRNNATHFYRHFVHVLPQPDYPSQLVNPREVRRFQLPPFLLSRPLRATLAAAFLFLRYLFLCLFFFDYIRAGFELLRADRLCYLY